MRDPPRGLPLDLLLGPIRMLRCEMAGDHPPGGGEHVARDLQTLGSRLRPQDASHVVVHDLDVEVIQGAGHDPMIAQPQGSRVRASPWRPSLASALHPEAGLARLWGGGARFATGKDPP